MSSQAAPVGAFLALTVPSNEADQVEVVDKDKEPTKEKVPELAKLLPAPKDSSKQKGESQGQVLVLATLPFTTKEDPKGNGAAQVIVPKALAQTATKANPPPPKSTQDFTYTLPQFIYLFIYF